MCRARAGQSNAISIGGPVSEGFYKRRRGILEHIEAGKIDLLESGIHDYLSLKANLVIGNGYPLPAGVCLTSSPAIHAHCPRFSERTIRRCLAHLERLDFIKVWKTNGKRGNYHVLICRASVHDLSGKEYRVNALLTTDWREPVYEPVQDVSAVCPQFVRSLSGNREVEKKEEREEKKPTPRFALPDWIPQPAWDDFVAMRKSLRAPLTEKAKDLVVKRLERMRLAGQDVSAVLEQSIERSWKGVFDLKEPQAKAGTNGKNHSTGVTEQNYRNLGFAGPKVADGSR
jgi:hypothetical protein